MKAKIISMKKPIDELSIVVPSIIAKRLATEANIVDCAEYSIAQIEYEAKKTANYMFQNASMAYTIALREELIRLK